MTGHGFQRASAQCVSLRFPVGFNDGQTAEVVSTRSSKSPRMSLICSNADSRSSAISLARICGSGRLAESSRELCQTRCNGICLLT